MTSYLISGCKAPKFHRYRHNFSMPIFWKTYKKVFAKDFIQKYIKSAEQKDRKYPLEAFNCFRMKDETAFFWLWNLLIVGFKLLKSLKV